MGAWVTDYLAGWAGEHGRVVHSNCAYRGPALSGDITIQTAEVVDKLVDEAGRHVIQVKQLMTSHSGTTMFNSTWFDDSMYSAISFGSPRRDGGSADRAPARMRARPARGSTPRHALHTSDSRARLLLIGALAAGAAAAVVAAQQPAPVLRLRPSRASAEN